MSIGKLTRVPLQNVWKHEARDFTTWLEENTDLLNECTINGQISLGLRRADASTQGPSRETLPKRVPSRLVRSPRST